MPYAVPSVAVVCDAYQPAQFQFVYSGLFLNLSQCRSFNRLTRVLVSLGKVPEAVPADQQVVSAPVGYQAASSVHLLEFGTYPSVCLLDVFGRYADPLQRTGCLHHADKIPALLAFFPEIALHITRPIRWDSDHVVLLDDETKEICKEILRCGGLEGKVYMALDYFDASINRVSAWVVGIRNAQKALLMAALSPDLTEMQNQGNWTELMVVQEEIKTLPFGDIWAEYCARQGVPADGEWFATVKAYEDEVLVKRV